MGRLHVMCVCVCVVCVFGLVCVCVCAWVGMLVGVLGIQESGIKCVLAIKINNHLHVMKMILR